MNLLSRSFLLAVLLLMVVIPVSAKPASETFYDSVYVDTDNAWLSMGAWDQSGWSGQSISVDVWTGYDYWWCYSEAPSLDLHELLQVPHGKGGLLELAVEIPLEECTYWGGPVPDIVSVDLTLTADTIYHDISHRNIVGGQGDNMNCQRWGGYDLEASGMIGGTPINYTYWGEMMSETCR